MTKQIFPFYFLLQERAKPILPPFPPPSSSAHELKPLPSPSAHELKPLPSPSAHPSAHTYALSHPPSNVLSASSSSVSLLIL
jgi:hypothetical protein